MLEIWVNLYQDGEVIYYSIADAMEARNEQYIKTIHYRKVLDW